MIPGYNFWGICPTCSCLVFGAIEHRCPDKVRAQMDAELDFIMEIELSTWNRDVEEFWASSDVQFYQHLLEQNDGLL